LHFGVCVAVGGVETSGEAAEDFEIGFAVCGVEDALRLWQLSVPSPAMKTRKGRERRYNFNAGRQRLLAQNM
jgi:hypothetical protein